MKKCYVKKKEKYEKKSHLEDKTVFQGEKY